MSYMILQNQDFSLDNTTCGYVPLDGARGDLCTAIS